MRPTAKTREKTKRTTNPATMKHADGVRQNPQAAGSTGFRVPRRRAGTMPIAETEDAERSQALWK